MFVGQDQAVAIDDRTATVDGNELLESVARGLVAVRERSQITPLHANSDDAGGGVLHDVLKSLFYLGEIRGD